MQIKPGDRVKLANINYPDHIREGIYLFSEGATHTILLDGGSRFRNRGILTLA